MGKEFIEGLITVGMAVVGVAIIATLVSNNANTAGVLTAGGNALGNAIRAATAPVTGSAGNTGAFFNPASWTGGAPIDTVRI